MCITGWLETPDSGEKAVFDAALASADFSREAAEANRYYRELTRGFRLSLPGEKDSATVCCP